MINITNLTVGYPVKKQKRDVERYKDGHYIAANEVSLSLDKGQCIGVIGENGSGKSSLLKVIVGLLKPLSGTFDKPEDSVIGYSHGESELIEHLTLKENIEIIALIHNIPKPDFDKRLNELDSIFSFSEYLELMPSDASSGMKQKVNIARTMIHDPDIIVLDEPTSAVDIVGVDLIQRYIRHEIERGKYVFLTSHYPFEISSLCNKLLIMQSGQPVFNGPLEELVNFDSDIEFVESLKKHIFNKENVNEQAA